MGGKIKFLGDQSEAELSQFLRSKIKNGQKVKMNLDNILGVGGESLVAKILQDKNAFKIIPLDDENDQTKNRIVEFQEKLKISKTDQIKRWISSKEKAKIFEEMSESSNLLTGRSEYDCASIKHENVINYANITLDFVNDQPCLIAGKINLY